MVSLSSVHLDKHPASPTSIKGNWSAYRRACDDYAQEHCKSNDSTDLKWLAQFNAAKIVLMREYLGGRRRSYTTKPKVLTPEFVEQAAVDNRRARVLREPYFVKIADLYQQIQLLEMDLDREEAINDADAAPDTRFALPA